MTEKVRQSSILNIQMYGLSLASTGIFGLFIKLYFYHNDYFSKCLAHRVSGSELRKTL